MKVLFATDGSHHATDAVRFLNRLSPTEPLDLTVMTVTYKPENLDAGSVRTWFPEWQKSEQNRIDAHYRELDQLLSNTEGSVRMVRLEGSPVPAILDTAKGHAVDLIALGARGHTTLERMLLGSVSDAVATHASCSVLIVRPPATSRSNSTPTESVSDGLKLTVAVDGSEGAHTAAKELLRFEWSPSDRITLLSVASMPDYLGQGYAMGPPAEHEKQRLGLAVKQVATETLKDIETRQILTEGLHVGETIVDFAKKEHEDLIVLGESGHTRFAELLLGSTSKYVIRHAPCSVWVARKKQVDS